LTLTRTVQKVGDERKRIAVLLGDIVKAAEINTESERSILLLDEEDGRTMRRTRRLDEAEVKILLEPISKSFKLSV
jgi:hypothetical protein